ncbi:Serine/threonine phosphatase stp [Bacteroidales bacterium Barb6XT]|nr:Serine/threonine phosphatase stp [Bacteroidales bacterium Barb6XT]
MDIYSFSGKGKREINEDYYANRQFDAQSSLHIVADGMGGYAHGEIAAEIAVKAIVDFFFENHQDQDIKKAIQKSLNIANEQIIIQRKSLHVKMGTTIAGLFIRRNIAYAFWLGDVHIYHFRNKEELFISKNHSLINEMRDKGPVSSKDIERYGNIVTKSLSGSTLEDDVPIKKLHLMPGDVLCICSDGLYNSKDVKQIAVVSNNELDETMKENGTAIEDNYTLIRIDLKQT